MPSKREELCRELLQMAVDAGAVEELGSADDRAACVADMTDTLTTRLRDWGKAARVSEMDRRILCQDLVQFAVGKGTAKVTGTPDSSAMAARLTVVLRTWGMEDGTR